LDTKLKKMLCTWTQRQHECWLYEWGMPTETRHARRLPTIPSGLWSRDARQTKRIGNKVLVLQDIARLSS
jgi:hypothetical protein